MQNRNLLLIVCLFLCAIGGLLIFSASGVDGHLKYGSSFLFVKKQWLGIALGVVSIGVIQIAGVDRLFSLRWLILFGAFIAMSLVMIPGVGHAAGGATRWVRLFGFGFQPSELTKIAFILISAEALGKAFPLTKERLPRLIPISVIFLCFVFLMMLQPDFGTTALLTAVFILLLWVAGLATKYFAILGVTIVALAGLAIWQAPYRMRRVLSFLDPWENVRDGGYQLVQSFLAFRNGGVLGVGLGESKQKLFFLPKSHTDFIFSIVGEELGLTGSLFVATCFAIVTYLGLQIAFKQRIKRRFFLALGISLLISLQAIFNLSVTLGLVPTKGISLPFVSAGTSSLLVFLSLIGILICLDREAEIDQSSIKNSSLSRGS